MFNLVCSRINSNARFIWWILFIIIIVAFYIVFSHHGLEIQNDSAAYIRGALNMKAGLGFTHAGEYINHFPIGLSYLYYLFMLFLPLSIFNTALLVNIILLIVMGLLFKALMRDFNIQESIQIAGLLLFFLSPPLIDMGARILTELPATVLILASTLLLVRKKNEPNSSYYIVLIGLFLGLGILIRFAMIGIIGAFALVIFWIYRQHMLKAFTKAILVCLPGILILISYSIYVKKHFQAPSVDRQLIWHPITFNKLINFIITPLSWIIQYKYNPLVQTVILSVIAGLIILSLYLLLKKTKHNIKTKLARILANDNLMIIIIISAVYCIFIITSISLFDGATPVDTRILSPISIFYYLGLTLLIQYAFQHSKNKNNSLLLAIGLAIVISWPAKYMLLQRYKYPQCYNTPYWQKVAKQIVNDTTSGIIKPHCTIYTNAYAFWKLCNNNKIEKLPDLWFDVNKINNDQYNEQMTAIREEIINNKAQLFFFYTAYSQPNKTKRSFIDSFFVDTNYLRRVYFNKGVIIEAK